MTDRELNRLLGDRVVILVTIVALLIMVLLITQDSLRAAFIGTLRTLGDGQFLSGFADVLLQVAIVSLVGGLIGVGAGFFILYSPWLAQGALRFLRIGLWIPFIGYAAVPFYPLYYSYQSPFTTSLTVLIVNLTAVTLYTCYHFLATRLLLVLEWWKALAFVAREAILQALFIGLISDLWLRNWDWLLFPLQGGPAAGYAVLVVLVLFLFVVNLIFRSNFKRTARVRGTILVKEMAGRNWHSLFSAFSLAVICVGMWQLLSISVFHFLASSPRQVLEAGYRLLITGTAAVNMGGKTMWSDIEFSLLRISLGMLASGFMALVVAKICSAEVRIRPALFSLLPLTYITPMVLWLFLFLLPPGWKPFAWHTTVAVAALTFFPFVHILWALGEQKLLCRLLLAVDESLPYAFVGMVFGENYNAISGLGFFIAVASVTGATAEAFAAFLVTLALLVGLSCILRSVAKRLYFSGGSERDVFVAAA